MQDEDLSHAVDEETGKINWNCKCLESALQPPCGYAFREAFQCFVESQTEPKGMDCEKPFLLLQKCFSENAAHYDSILKEEASIEDNKSTV